MNVLVIGAGAVGSFLGWTLRSAGHEVTLAVRHDRSANTMSGEEVPPDRDLSLIGPQAEAGTVRVAVARTPADVRQPPDLIIAAVKMMDLDSAMDVAAAWPAAAVLAVENGIGADELILRRRPRGGILAGSLTTAVSLDDGTVRRLSTGGIGLATVREGSGPSPAKLAAAFSAGGLRARVLQDAIAMRWSKLLANLVGNATSAVLDADPADVYADPRLFSIERQQLREAVAVMGRLGLPLVALPGADVRPLGLAIRLPAAVARPILRRVVTAARGGKSPSLRLAVQAGGATEVDWLQGSVARAARELGGRARVNERLSQLVRECSSDPERRAWFRGRPDRLVDALD